MFNRASYIQQKPKMKRKHPHSPQKLQRKKSKTTVHDLGAWEKELTQKEQQLQTREAEVNTLEQAIIDRHSEREKELNERQSQLDVITDKLNSTTTIGGKNQKIKLSIGGTLFVTSLDTLTTEKDTYFSALLSEHFNTQPDEDGEIFIDRDPTHFRLILNHLRSVDISKEIEALNEREMTALEHEVDFYQISSMFHWFPDRFRHELRSMGVLPPKPQFDMDYCSSEVTLLDDRTHLKTNLNRWHGCITEDPCKHYAIRLLKNCPYLTVGMAPKANFETVMNTTGYYSCGWYINTTSGNIYSQDGHSDSQYFNTDCDTEGTVIEVKLENGNLLFIVNGTNLSTACSGLPNELYPAFFLYGDVEFEFIDC
jgi:hypothetical protein